MVVHAPPKGGVLAFIGWFGVGACITVALFTPFTIGWIAWLAAVAGIVGLLAWPGGRSAAAFGALSGAGAIPVYVAWLNRRGPGEVCTSTARSTHCVEEWNPVLWLIFGVVLVVSGIVAAIAVTARTAEQDR